MTTSPLLDRFYGALKALSPEALADCVSEDFVLNWQGCDAIPWAGTWRGVDGLLAFVALLNQHLEIVEVQRLKQFADEEMTVVLLQGHWRIKATGQEVHAMACNVFAIEGGRIKRYTVVNNTAAFVEACATRPLASE